MTPASRVAVAVVVPAHQEERSVGRCVASVRRALEHAHRRGLLSDSRVVVVAHRCTDATARTAADALPPGGVVLLDDESSSVGEVRARGVAVALRMLGTPPARTWILNTDADTLVPVTWVTRLLREAGRHRSRTVVGLARLDRWRGSLRGWAAYRALVRSGLRQRRGLHQHDHVYGANLAVRADAYGEAGGFEACAVAEDHRLVQRLVAHGHPVLRTRAVTVRTSGRREGRAAGGLADRIVALDRRDRAVTGRVGEAISVRDPA